MAIWTVPAGYTFYLTRYYASIEGNAAIGADIELVVRESGGAFNTKHFQHVSLGGPIDYQFEYPLVIGAQSDVLIRAVGSANNAEVAAGFDGYYELN
jgi:hypothetical protein